MQLTWWPGELFSVGPAAWAACSPAQLPPLHCPTTMEPVTLLHKEGELKAGRFSESILSFATSARCARQNALVEDVSLPLPSRHMVDVSPTLTHRGRRAGLVWPWSTTAASATRRITDGGDDLNLLIVPSQLTEMTPARPVSLDTHIQNML